MNFGPYRLDPRQERLWRHERELRLRPKAMAVLRYLLERRGRLVTRGELLAEVWKGTRVCDGVLKVCIREIRQVLGDEAGSPRFIETVPWRGYRWIAPLAEDEAGRVVPAPPPGLAAIVVGREREIGELGQCLERARRGERQVVFVTGEAGIGKTTLVDAFLLELEAAIGDRSTPIGRRRAGSRRDGSLWIARGQSIEQFGAGEPYLPLLAALSQLCRGPAAPSLVECLSRHAPTWLGQMPGLLGPGALEELERRTVGTTAERMLRELAEALEVVTAPRRDTAGETGALPPLLVLVLEDLQWSDAATLDFLSLFARRRQPARLMLIGTFRPVEVIVRGHPLRGLKRDLQVHGHCREIALAPMSELAVEQYLARRFGDFSSARGSKAPGSRAARKGEVHELGHAIHRRTEGNPLFVVNVVDDLIAKGVLAEERGRWRIGESAGAALEGVPENLRQMIDEQAERLPAEDRELLEVASVAGVEFSAAAVAAAIRGETVEVERRCEELARRTHWLQPAGTARWPDGTVAAAYAFGHSLYREVLYAGVTESRRAFLHQRLGERLEAAYEAGGHELAAQLAVHFERSHDHRRAILHYQRAAANAARRYAFREVMGHCQKGLERLGLLGEGEERSRLELRLQALLGPAVMAAEGWDSPAMAAIYPRAQKLSQELGETRELFWMTMGLWAFHLIRGEIERTRELADELVALAERLGERSFFTAASCAAGSTSFYAGELCSARGHLERTLELYEPEQHPLFAERMGFDPAVVGSSHLAVGTLWPLGLAEQAERRMEEALDLSARLAHPHSRIIAVCSRAWLHQRRGEADAAGRWADECVALSSEAGILFWRSFGVVLRGWARSLRGELEEGIREMRDGIRAHGESGARAVSPHFLALLAEGQARAGRLDEALAAIAEALESIETTGERYYEAELHRLAGLFAWRRKAVNAESSLLRAVEIARRQGALSFELRAALDLGRLWLERGEKRAAADLLGEVYGRFTEGFDTGDLRAAHQLAERLGGLPHRRARSRPSSAPVAPAPSPRVVPGLGRAPRSARPERGPRPP